MLISAILGNPQSSPAKVLAAMFHGKFESFSSTDATKEFYQVLFSEKILNYFKDNLSFLTWTFLIVNSMTKKVSPLIKLNICRDPPYDNMFLEIAYEAKAEYIVTLDTDLLDLRDDSKEIAIFEHKVKILRPDEFIREIS